jgi:glutathione S-transferase
MKLYYSPTSPYVRKVMIFLNETGLVARVELLHTNVWAPDTTHGEINPLGKIPVLTLEDGVPLYDSPVIVDYLDSLHDGTPLIPAAHPRRHVVLCQQALADGIMDAAILRRLENSRPEAERSNTWSERQLTSIVRAIDMLEADVEDLGEIDIGAIAVACALGYLDLRLPEFDWRSSRPKLAAWFQIFAERPSFRLTRPPEGA